MKNKAFTLVELLVTMAVFVILVALGAPRLNNMINNNRLVSDINTLSADLSYARSEAINRNRRIAVNASGADWSNGWTIVVASTNSQLRINQGVAPGLSMLATNNNITYLPDGSIAAANISFRLCENSRAGNYGKTIAILSTGRAELLTGANCP